MHQLPGLRDLLLAELGSRPGMLVRSTALVQGPGHVLKRAVIARTGGRALGRRLQALGRARNACLRGVYDFRTADYRGLMQGWLQDLPARGALILCHPGQRAAGDPIAAARQRELDYLDSPAFDDDLASAGAALEPFIASLRRQTTSAG